MVKLCTITIVIYILYIFPSNDLRQNMVTYNYKWLMCKTWINVYLLIHNVMIYDKSNKYFQNIVHNCLNGGYQILLI